MYVAGRVCAFGKVCWCFEPSQPHRVTSGLISEKVCIWSYEFSERGEVGRGGGGSGGREETGVGEGGGREEESVLGKASKLLPHCPPLCSVVVPLHRQERPARRCVNPSLCPRGSRPVSPSY